MKSSTIASAALLAAYPAHASHPHAFFDATKIIRRAVVQQPSVMPVQDAVTSQGCYSSSGNLNLRKPVPNMSTASCSLACKADGFAVAGMQGSQCFCGNSYPPANTVVEDNKCNFPCPSYPLEACGSTDSPGYWSIFNTGVKLTVPALKASSSASASPSASSTDNVSSPTRADASATSSAAAVSQSASSAAPQPDNAKSGPNTAGIAAGVVVGVVAAAGIIGAVFFFLRRKRNAEIEEEHRRNAAVSAFINGSKPPGSSGSVSMTDSRLDPVLANRRLSDGSIADNQDYSRRILRVCIPYPSLIWPFFFFCK